MKPILIAACAPLLGACTASLFSGVQYPERNQPVARIETRGGVEFGATTQAGILFLGRTATEGPCRVHYFLGPQLIIEDGTIEATSSVYFRADIDLRHQNAPVWTRKLDPTDQLVALALRGALVQRIPVRLARHDDISGDVLEHPGVPLPVGTGIFRRDPDDPDDQRLAFVGLVAGEATIDSGAAAGRYLVFTGIDRLRELDLEPRLHPAPSEIKFRPDGIHVRRTIERPNGAR